MTDTVRMALRQAADAAARARQQWLREGGLEELGEPGARVAVVATCATLDAEAHYSARTRGGYEQIRADRRRAYEHLPTEDRHWRAAFAAQRELARTGRHRAVGFADLLTAVLAGEHRLTLLHDHNDFVTAAEVINFDHRWVAERGTLP